MAGKNGHNFDPEEMRENINEELDDIKRDFGKHAKEVRKGIVKQLLNTARTIRKEAREARASGNVKSGADNVAKRLERAAHYLEHHDADDIERDTRRSIQRSPFRAVAVVFVAGLLVGIWLRNNDR